MRCRCGFENPPGARVCLNCGLQLNSDQKAGGYFITCPVCGKEYEVGSTDSRIERCDFCTDPVDRLMIAHEKAVSRKPAEKEKTQREENPPEREYILHMIGSNESFKLTSGLTLGREGDIVIDNPFISRRLFRFYIEDDSLYMELLSASNPSFLDSEQLKLGKKYKLYDNAMLQCAELFLLLEVK